MVDLAHRLPSVAVDDAVPSGRDRDARHRDDLAGADDHRPGLRAPLSAPLRPRADPAPSCGALPGDPPAAGPAPRDRPGRPRASTAPTRPCPRGAACRTRARRERRRRGRPPSCRPARRAARRATPRGARGRRGRSSPRARRFASAPGCSRRSSGRISSRISPRAVSRIRLVDPHREAVARRSTPSSPPASPRAAGARRRPRGAP